MKPINIKVEVGREHNPTKNSMLFSPVYLELRIDETDDTGREVFRIRKDANGKEERYDITIGSAHMTTTHKQIYRYKRLSLTGSSRNFSGQIQSHLTPDEINFTVPYSRIKRIVEIWNRYHLNDMQPNCEHQNSFGANAANFNARAAMETRKCPHGYAYGSAWLVEELPEHIEREIVLLFQELAMFHAARGGV